MKSNFDQGNQQTDRQINVAGNFYHYGSDPQAAVARPSRPAVLHNLPQRDYTQFIGRAAELQKVQQILRPYPHSQHAFVSIDGIGGVGKSTLALEVAHRYLDHHESLPPDDRFAAIIWTSAKERTLTGDGIKPRYQTHRTLDDLYRTIAITLQREDIAKALFDQQAALLHTVLIQQRTLVIVDNLETIDDEAVINFIRELPAPTKVIVTTRHRIDVAYAVRLTGMPWQDAEHLIAQECRSRAVELSPTDTHRLFNRTGGVPLAIVWSVAQMGFGYLPENVLTRLGSPTNDIIRFCFDQALKLIAGQNAEKLLIALSHFTGTVSRETLGRITQLMELDRDDGLVMLEKLSLVNKQGDLFSMLPVTKVFATDVAIKNHMLFVDYAKRINPFHFGPVVFDEFVGRWHLIREIATELTYGQNSYACIGGRRFGKSSVLKAIGYILQSEKALEGRVLPLYVDSLLHNYTNSRDVFVNLYDSFHQNAREIVKYLYEQRSDNEQRPAFTSIEYASVLNAIDVSANQQLNNATPKAFGRAINRVIDTLEKISGPCRVVLLIDEIDSFLDMTDHTLFSQLRALLYDDPTYHRLRLVLAGSSHFADEVTSRASPLFNVLQTVYLVAFDEVSTDELMARLPELDAPLRKTIWSESGGHPFIITYLLYHLRQHLLRQPDQQLTINHVNAFVDRFLQTEAAHLNGWSKAIGLTGLQIYGLFVAEDSWLARSTIAQRVGDPKLDITAALNALCYHGFLLPDEAWGRFCRNGNLFRRWYQNEIARLVHELTPRQDGQLLLPPFFRDLIVHGPLQPMFDQRWQTVDHQTNIAGDVKTDGGMINNRKLNSDSDRVIGRNSSGSRGEISEKAN